MKKKLLPQTLFANTLQNQWLTKHCPHCCPPAIDSYTTISQFSNPRCFLLACCESIFPQHSFPGFFLFIFSLPRTSLFFSPPPFWLICSPVCLFSELANPEKKKSVLMSQLVRLRIIFATLVLVLVLLNAVQETASQGEFCNHTEVVGEKRGCRQDQEGLVTDSGFIHDPLIMASCRSFCASVDPSQTLVTIETVSLTCTICGTQDVLLKYRTSSTAVWPFNNGQLGENLCIPETVCRTECRNDVLGENCFFSGTCKHKLCFKMKPGNDAFEIGSVELTHTGLGSQVIVRGVGNGTDTRIVPATPTDRPIPADIQYAVDRCGKETFTATLGSVSSVSSHVPFVDGRAVPGANGNSCTECRENKQCRMFNYDFGRQSDDKVSGHFEIVRNITMCTYCNEDSAQKEYFQGSIDSRSVCIPHSVCEDKCGPVQPGCRYSGTCGSIFCLSGRRSKRPAYFPFMTDDGSISAAVVNNDDAPDPNRNIHSPPLYQSEPLALEIDDKLNFWDENANQAACVSHDPGFSAEGIPQYGGGGAVIIPTPSPSPSSKASSTDQRKSHRS